MDSQPVNWGILDALVLDYGELEELFEVEDSESSLPRDPGPRHMVELIRGLIESGQITEALAVIEQHFPTILDDPRLLFRLHKQRFLELLRGGEGSTKDEAIACSRTTLGPCALNAYPEAYEEFKRVLLTLMYDKDDPFSPVTDEWSEVRRSELAATIASTLKAHLHAYDPVFSLLLRYLLSVQNAYCLQRGMSSPIADIASSLLSKDRDPPAAPLDSLLEAPNYREADVQALTQAVELPRQGAVNSLRYTHGDLVTAFKNELSRLRLNVPLVDEFVHEYCLYRGLIERGPITSGSNESSSDTMAAELTSVLALDVVNLIKAMEVKNSASDQSKDVMDAGVKDSTVSILVDLLETEERDVESICANGSVKTHLKLKPQINANINIDSDLQSARSAEDVVMQDYDEGKGCDSTDLPQNLESQREDEQFRTCGACSTSGQSLSGCNDIHTAGLGNGIGRGNGTVPSTVWRRWRGRRPLVSADFCEGSGKEISDKSQQPHPSLELPQMSNLGDLQEMKIGVEKQQEPPDNIFETYGRARAIRQLACEGKTEEVIREVQRLHPKFFEHNPHLLFQLKQVEFLKLVADGSYPEALRVARADLGPLAAKYSELLKPLKETLLALARPCGELPLKPTPPVVLAAALQVALGASLGIAEPQLMKVMRSCLYMHTEWFKLQMCSDRFEELLRINVLKEMEANSSGSTGVEAKVESGVGSGSQTINDPSCARSGDGSGSQQSESSREGLPFDEMSILTIMEWMALSRGDAIQLLTQYDGSVDSVFANLI